jgi:hypothetical protein
MAWRWRPRVRSYNAEHFHYEAPQRHFVVDEPQLDIHADRPSSPRREVKSAEYLVALGEVRREIARRPADEWETGLLIKLYARTTDLLKNLSGLSARERAHYPSHLDQRLMERIVDVLEAMILRHNPGAPEAITACLKDLRPGTATRLNQVADSIQMPDGSAMLAVWLASFDQPYHVNVEVRDGLRPRGRRGFMDVCATLVKDILAEAGSVANEFTIGGHPDAPAGK